MPSSSDDPSEGFRVHRALRTRQYGQPYFAASLGGTGAAARDVSRHCGRGLQAGVGGLTRLKGIGVQLHGDDFGTGYSSLSYLQRLPVDTIKIDQSFVAQITSNHDADVIVRSTIELGHNLDLTVIAEGVESREVWSRLVGRDCDAAQGFFIARPIPAEQFTYWEHQSPWRSARPHS